MFKFNSCTDKKTANLLNPVVLAFVGDAVYTLFVREKLAFGIDAKAGALNKLSAKTVSAKAQAELIEKLLPIFTEEELAVFKRARNSKKATKAKNATVSEYNASTGFEAVIGYLYITGDYERLNYLLNYEKE
jgi:ribonuclease-3 family protein